MNPLASELLRKLKRQNQSLNAAERALERVAFSGMPPVIQIEPTNRCNLRCQSCARNFYDESRNPPADFPAELFEKLDLPFAFASTVLFGGYGEPTLGFHFTDLLSLASDYGCRTEIITNGTQIDKNLAQFLCEMNVDRIIFSVDAASDSEMQRLRGIPLSDILGNIELLRSVGGLDAPAVAFNFTLNINNLDHLKPLVSLAATQDVTDVFVAHQKIYDPSQSGNSAFLHPNHVRLAFDEVKKLAREQDINVQLPPLEGTAACHQPLELMMIASDGRVQGCCSALFQGGEPKIALGSLWDSDIEQLWNHPMMQQARAAAYGQGQWPAPCGDCAFRVFNQDSHLRNPRSEDEGEP